MHQAPEMQHGLITQEIDQVMPTFSFGLSKLSLSIPMCLYENGWNLAYWEMSSSRKGNFSFSQGAILQHYDHRILVYHPVMADPIFLQANPWISNFSSGPGSSAEGRHRQIPLLRGFRSLIVDIGGMVKQDPVPLKWWHHWVSFHRQMKQGSSKSSPTASIISWRWESSLPYSKLSPVFQHRWTVDFISGMTGTRTESTNLNK